MIKHAALTFGATLLAIGALIATAPAHTAPAASAAVTEADTCSETIMADLDAIAEGPNDNVPAPNYRTLVADCAALGTDAAYVKHVGPALTPCAFEDGSGQSLPCYWDGSARGNREGSSYIVTADQARAEDCSAALAHALPSLRDRYYALCVAGYAIEGVPGMAYQG